MNRTELKKVMSDFNSISNRLLQAAYADYMNVLRKFYYFIETTEIIKEFIEDCGGFDEQNEPQIDEIMNHYGSYFVFSLDDKEETSQIYSLIRIVCNRDYQTVPRGLIGGYATSSSKYDDKLKDFNHRVIRVLILHVDDYLKKVGIDMGLDNNVTYNINGTQVNIANNNSTINAVQNNEANAEKIAEYVSALRSELDNELSDEDKEEANEYIDTIEQELVSGNPSDKNIKKHFRLLHGIDGSVKFLSACCSLMTFADKLYPFLGNISTWLQTLG